jgi:hypothetical protein
MVHRRALALGLTVGVGTTLVVALALPSFFQSALPVPLLPFLVGPLPGAFLAGYLVGEYPWPGARYGFAVGALPFTAVYLLLATLLGYGFLADGVASGDPGGGAGLSLLVVLAATLGLPLLLATQVGAVVAGAAGGLLGATTTPVSEP